MTVDNLKELQIIKRLCLRLNKAAKIHIAVNTGMNRIGVKYLQKFKQMLSFICKNKLLKLKGVFTHCFDADIKNSHFYKQMKVFKKYIKYIKNKNVLIHIGGSFCLTKKIPNFVNMVRVGLFIYGYGVFKLKPVMSITSKVIKITKCKRGESVGYGSTLLKKDSTIGLVPLGYADGLPINLSNKADVIINNQKCKIIGRICMDMLMVDITNKKVKLFDSVIVFNNADYFAKLCKTSTYEILTNFNKIRAKEIIC